MLSMRSMIGLIVIPQIKLNECVMRYRSGRQDAPSDATQAMPLDLSAAREKLAQ